jgi:hypothetical protein
MSSSDDFVREYQGRFEKKLKENEIALLEHWKAQLDKVITMRPESVASWQSHISKISEMMHNGITLLKKEKNG